MRALQSVALLSWGVAGNGNYPECQIAPLAEDLIDDEYKIFYDEPITFDEAREKCHGFGEFWDLVIFNYEREHTRINKILTDNCVGDYAYWIGYTDKNHVTRTVYDQVLRSRKEGFTTSIPLPWEVNEPNDAMGPEECIRMRNGKLNDAPCSITWTGPKKAGNGMGYICERHNPCEYRRSGTNFTEYVGDDYIIPQARFIDAIGAKKACQAYGKGWDLAVIETGAEMKKIYTKITDGCLPYWTGMRERDGVIYSLDDKTVVTYAPWDAHLGHGFKSQPNSSPTGSHECVRMRGGLYNDADCEDKNGFTNKEPMGYICEQATYKGYVKPTKPAYTPPAQKVSLTCDSNESVSAWKVRTGCAKPNCDAKLTIVDAWRKTKHRQHRYGFIGLIHIPKDVVDTNQEYSVVIRFSKAVTHGHFQLWNMRFWNFYNGGYEILIHSKQWKTDRHDKYSIGFVAEGLNSDEYPELLFWTKRQTRHQCFQQTMHYGQSARSFGQPESFHSYEAILSQNPHVDGEEVTGVRIRNGQVTRVQGQKMKNPQG